MIYKKIIFTLTVLFCVLNTVNAQNVSLRLNPVYFTPSESLFEEVYGGGLMWRGGVEIDVHKFFSYQISGSYFGKMGRLTHTKEETELKIIRIHAGGCFKFSYGRFTPYIGLDLGLNLFNESNRIGTVKKTKIGYLADAGILTRLTGRLLLDFKIDYTRCSIPSDEGKVDIGGLGISCGIGINL